VRRAGQGGEQQHDGKGFVHGRFPPVARARGTAGIRNASFASTTFQASGGARGASHAAKAAWGMSAGAPADGGEWIIANLDRIDSRPTAGRARFR
jgi:hypothetical protein